MGRATAHRPIVSSIRSCTRPGCWPIQPWLSTLIEVYEDEHFAVASVSPQEAVDVMLEQRGLGRSYLADLMRGRSRVSEFFSGRRDLSKSQIEALHHALGIPAWILMGLG
jgi:HTH-type transcriptional regulator/antitoxin HigA